MVDRSQIRSGMEVVASDGGQVGKVDHVEGEEIRLSGADGKQRLVPLTWVERVDAHVHLNVGRDRLAGLAAVAAGAAGATTLVGATSKPASGDELPGPLPPVTNPAVEGAKARGNYYLPWILGALLLLALLFVLLKALDEGIEDGRDGRDDDDRAAITDTRRGDASYASGTIAGDLDRFLRSDEPAPRTFTFDRLNFDRGVASVRPVDIVDMDQLAQVLTAYPTTRIAIIGYTDAEGSGRANARLGQERADAVAAALSARGISRERLEARSGGEQAPIADNDRSEGRAENRRTELIVLAR